MAPRSSRSHINVSQGKRVILHVTEASSGVISSVSQMALLSPSFRHVLLRLQLRDHLGDSDGVSGVDEVIYSGAGVLPSLRVLRKMMVDYRPIAIHAHSSFAGALVRLLPAKDRIKIVYSPHCYAFERLDLGKLRRSGLYLLE